MTYVDIIKKSVLEGFIYGDLSTVKIVITLAISYIVAMYIHLVYKMISGKSFYNKNYGICMVIIAVITSGIILAMQSSIVISLGMVGALSIVRFRTAIKDPMDLLFLFWSIGNGIVCGAGLYDLAVIMSIIATGGIFLFELLPARKKSYLLVINAKSRDTEERIYEVLKEKAGRFTVRNKNITKEELDIIIEVKIKGKDTELVDELLLVDSISSVSLLENETIVNA